MHSLPSAAAHQGKTVGRDSWEDDHLKINAYDTFRRFLEKS